VPRSLELLNVNGQRLLATPLLQNQHSLPVGTLPSGVYLLKIMTDRGVLVRRLNK
jgi:hypothetical protein